MRFSARFNESQACFGSCYRIREPQAVKDRSHLRNGIFKEVESARAAENNGTLDRPQNRLKPHFPKTFPSSVYEAVNAIQMTDAFLQMSCGYCIVFEMERCVRYILQARRLMVRPSIMK